MITTKPRPLLIIYLIAFCLFSVVPRYSGRAKSGQTQERNTPQQIQNSLGMTLVLIKPGTFTMGAKSSEPNARSDENQYKVTLTKPYYMAAHEVTVGQFRQFVEAQSKRPLPDSRNRQQPRRGRTARPVGLWLTDAERGGQTFEDGKPGGYMISTEGTSKFYPKVSWRNPPWKQTDKHPAIFLSWKDADAFVKWLSAKERRQYRLPTEAEWEYVCRAGTTTAYWWGDKPDTTGRVANVGDYSFRRYYPTLQNMIEADDGHAFTAPVGSYQPNQFGLYDIIGNAWEWVGDFYADPTEHLIDPKGPERGFEKIARGGGYATTFDRSRCAARFHDLPENRFSGTGFRVVLEVN